MEGEWLFMTLLWDWLWSWNNFDDIVVIVVLFVGRGVRRRGWRRLQLLFELSSTFVSSLHSFLISTTHTSITRNHWSCATNGRSDGITYIRRRCYGGWRRWRMMLLLSLYMTLGLNGLKFGTTSIAIGWRRYTTTVYSCEREKFDVIVD